MRRERRAVHEVAQAEHERGGEVDHQRRARGEQLRGDELRDAGEATSTDSAMLSKAVMPEATQATPATKPNGMVPASTGATSRHPARNSARASGDGNGLNATREKRTIVRERVCYHRGSRNGIAAMKKIVLLRHGESTWNKENRFTGWTDVDLTAKGVEEARAAGRPAEGRGLRLRPRLHLGAEARDPHAATSRSRRWTACGCRWRRTGA